MHYFIGLVIISVCVKCFNIDVCIYGTLLILSPPPPFFSFFFLSSWIFVVVILILMYAFIVLVLFVVVVVVVDCKADFDVDNVQRRELVNFYGV